MSSETRPESWAEAVAHWPALERVTPLVDPVRLEEAAAIIFGGDGGWVTELLNDAGCHAIALEICVIGGDARTRVERLFGLLGGALSQLAAREAIASEFVIQTTVARIDAPSRH